MRRSGSPAPQSNSTPDCSILKTLTTDLEWLEVLPRLVAHHGEQKVNEEALKLLSRSQLKECWKRLEARKTMIVWLDCAISEPGARLLELAIVLTDRSLNEVERGEWVLGELSEKELHALPRPEYSLWCDKEEGGTFPPVEPGAWGNGLLAEVHRSPLTGQEASAQIVQFLSMHCTKGCIVAGTALAHDLQVIERLMPDVYHALDCSAPIDVGHHGARRYAELTGNVLNASSDLSSGPRTIEEFEAAHRVGDDPAQLYEGRPTRAVENLENSIVALGWVRMHFFPPPKAAKYVIGTLGFLCILLLVSVFKLITTETMAWYSAI